MKLSTVIPCIICSMIHSMGQCHAFTGTCGYSNCDQMFNQPAELIAESCKIRVCVEPEIIPIPARDRGRDDYHPKYDNRICFYGPHAPSSVRRDVTLDASPRYCHKGWRQLRDAIACQKANILAYEAGSKDLVPFLWTGQKGEEWSAVPGWFLPRL